MFARVCSLKSSEAVYLSGLIFLDTCTLMNNKILLVNKICDDDDDRVYLDEVLFGEVCVGYLVCAAWRFVTVLARFSVN